MKTGTISLLLLVTGASLASVVGGTLKPVRRDRGLSGDVERGGRNNG